MNGASAEYVTITEPSREAPRLTRMLVQAFEEANAEAAASAHAASLTRRTWRFSNNATSLQRSQCSPAPYPWREPAHRG